MGNKLFIPTDALKPYVRSIVIAETKEESTYRVLPDTGVVLGFQYKGRLSFLEDDRDSPLFPYGITGIRDQYRLFKNSSDIGTILVFFREGGAAPFFKMPIHEIFGESVSLENFVVKSHLLILEERLLEAKTDLQKVEAVEKFLITQMTNCEEDKLVTAALAMIRRNNGNIRITELAELLNTSQSPLEKRFRKLVGASPKKFTSIVRLKYAIKNHNSSHSLTELGYVAGFYDQAHFIKEFKSFTGETPEVFFKRIQ